MTTPATYSSLDGFYRDNPARRASRELDFGVWWISGKNRMRTYRLTWVADTGELIVVGTHERVRVITSIPKEETVERVLHGWPEKCGEEGSLEWVYGRLLDHMLNREEEAPWFGQLTEVTP